MDRRSPWYYFSRDSVGSLRRREARGEPLTPEDIQRVVDATPDAHSNPELAVFVERVHSGDIRARRGRPRKEYPPLPIIDFLYEERKDEIWACRRLHRARVRGDFEPCVEAAEYVARTLRLASGRALLNWRSEQNRLIDIRYERHRRFFMKEKERH